jgi:hypothetical protein
MPEALAGRTVPMQRRQAASIDLPSGFGLGTRTLAVDYPAGDSEIG